MPELIRNKTAFTLLEVTTQIKNTISGNFAYPLWIKAEMNKLNHHPSSGHCYPDLVQKQNGLTIVEMKSIIWKSDYLKINLKFQQVLKENLKDSITILLCARISYDPKYGLQLRILDIDPSYSLGEIEREKNETIERLKNENIFYKNRELSFPTFPKRLAIISVETSKGYSDFINVIKEYSNKFKLYQHLFPAILDGDRAIPSIISQLKNIKKVKNHFDAVLIIRGGGGEVGLTCYNNYNLSNEVATFPIPIFTGIGHSTNKTVVELVAHTDAITPTKLAELISRHFLVFTDKLEEYQKCIIHSSRKMIIENKMQFYDTVKYLRLFINNLLMLNNNKLELKFITLSQQVKFSINHEWDNNAAIISLIKNYIPTFLQSAKDKLINKSTTIKKDVMANIRQTKQYINQNVNSIKQSVRFLILSNIRNVKNYQENLLEKVKIRIKNEDRDIISKMTSMRKDVKVNIHKSTLYLNQDSYTIKKNTKFLFISNYRMVLESKDKIFEKTNYIVNSTVRELSNIERIVNNMNPINVMKRGYSFTLVNGKVLKNVEQVKLGGEIKTYILDGDLISKITKINKSEDE